MRKGRAALPTAVWLAVAPAGAAPPPEPADFRDQAYRAPTPETLKGATVLSSAEAHALWLSGRAAFIDVLPQAPRPKNLPANVVWRDPARDDIPGSLWLPDTGYGALVDAMRDYFVAGLRKAAGGDDDRALVFYCQRDCWMSWNAGKRALALGFKHVDWYPEGVDGWREAGFPLEAAKAEPRPP